MTVHIQVQTTVKSEEKRKQKDRNDDLYTVQYPTPNYFSKKRKRKSFLGRNGKPPGHEIPRALLAGILSEQTLQVLISPSLPLLLALVLLVQDAGCKHSRGGVLYPVVWRWRRCTGIRLFDRFVTVGRGCGRVLLTFLRPRGFLERMRETLLGEFESARDKTLFICILRRENGDDVVFGVGFIALDC